jgi:hypothetical protein
MDVSPSLVVYGEQIAVPPQLIFNNDPNPDVDLPTFVERIENELTTLRNYILENDLTLRGPPPDDPAVEFPWRHIWIKDPILRGSLKPKYLGPFQVVDYEYPVITYRYQNQLKRINIDRCRPAHVLPEDPVLRGRPEALRIPVPGEEEYLDRIRRNNQTDRRFAENAEFDYPPEDDEHIVPPREQIIPPEVQQAPEPQQPAPRNPPVIGPHGGYETRAGRQVRQPDWFY